MFEVTRVGDGARVGDCALVGDGAAKVVNDGAADEDNIVVGNGTVIGDGARVGDCARVVVDVTG